MEIKCKICNQTFNHSNDGVCIRMMCNHLKKEHNLSKEDYLVQYYHNGIHPKCKCGCGHDVKCGKGWNVFNDYYNCTHIVRSKEDIQKMHEALQEKINSKEYICNKYGESALRSSLDKFKTHKKTLSEIAEDLNTDKRTIKHAWIRLRWISLEEIETLAIYNQKIKSKQTVENNFKEIANYYSELYTIAKNNPQKYTIHSLIEEYNLKHPDNYILNCDRTVLKKLKEHYSDEIINLLLDGYHSKEELQFAEILSFYFGKENVKIGFKLQYDNSSKKHVYLYDICLYNKLIIEYDGRGYFHTEERKLLDIAKEKYAIDNGYIFLRVSLSSAKTIELLNKIQNLVNDKICRNN